MKAIMGHIIIPSPCRDAVLALQSEPNSEICSKSRITVYSMFKQLSERNQLHYITSDTLRPTNTQKYCIRQYLLKNTGRPSRGMMQAPVRASIFIFLNIPHTIEGWGAGMFIKEMTDHNISLIGLNRNATTILQITP